MVNAIEYVFASHRVLHSLWLWVDDISRVVHPMGISFLRRKESAIWFAIQQRNDCETDDTDHRMTSATICIHFVGIQHINSSIRSVKYREMVLTKKSQCYTGRGLNCTIMGRYRASGAWNAMICNDDSEMEMNFNAIFQQKLLLFTFFSYSGSEGVLLLFSFKWILFLFLRNIPDWLSLKF